MIVKLIRKEFTEQSTIGEVFINGKFLCYSLEDKDRGLNDSDQIELIALNKVHSKTAIPYGTYQCGFTMSNRFQRVLPEVYSVKGFRGIRIHSGNKPEDSEGCILLGMSKQKDFIGESRTALSNFFLKVAPAKQFTLEITKI
jgi:hypothetical protein